MLALKRLNNSPLMIFKYLIIFVLLFAQLSAQAEERLQITVSAINTGPSPPYRWFNYCSGQWNGSAIQTVRRIFKELNVQVTFDIPIKPSYVYSVNLPEKLRSGKSDAVLSMPIMPSPGVSYLPTPIIELGLGVFYPAVLGKITRIEQLETLPGFFYNRHMPDKSKHQSDATATLQLIEQWGDKNKLSITGIGDVKKYKAATNGVDDHFVIDSKYSTLIDRKKYQLLTVDLKLASYYFALADRPPWAEMGPIIDKKIQYIRESGLLALLEQANLKRWVSERKTNMTCKNNFQLQ
jgi:hypothetical protein